VDDRDVYDGKADLVAQLFKLGEPGQQMWRREELREILRHQLSAPVEFDFGYLGPEATDRLDKLLSQADPPVRSFHDLLHHPAPPVELLVLTKEFARAGLRGADALLPREIASMLYVLSIVAAMKHCGCRITKLDTQGLRHILDWALEQPWVDESTRAFLQEGYQITGDDEASSNV